MKECFVSKSFSADRLVLIATIDDIVEEYQNQGYRLTTRQVYYQLVARGHIENTLQSYKRIAALINDAKLAGMLDWDALEDRTREFITRNHWRSPSSIIRACAEQYHEDLWVGQDMRVFVIIEKEALVGVLQSTCHRMDVPLLAARGYPSGSVLYEFVQEHITPCLEDGQDIKILHLGDHDPSGIDMTRDLIERLRLFAGTRIDLRRIALNMPQVEELRPPENPAKTTDSRYKQYIKSYGMSSWELDALQPSYLNRLVQRELDAVIDTDVWEQRKADIREKRQAIEEVADKFDEDYREQ